MIGSTGDLRIEQALRAPASTLSVTAYQGFLKARRGQSSEQSAPRLHLSDSIRFLPREFGQDMARERWAAEYIGRERWAKPYIKRLLQAVGSDYVPGSHLSESAHIPPTILLELLASGTNRVFEVKELADLACQLPSYGILRWPALESSIDRNYWNNCIRLYSRLQGAVDELCSQDVFEFSLRKMNLFYLMGEDLNTFYFPASPLLSIFFSDLSLGPGQFRRGPVSCMSPLTSGNAYFEILRSRFEEQPCDSCPLPIVGAGNMLLGERQSTRLRQTHSNGDSVVSHYQTAAVINGEHITALQKLAGSVLGANASISRDDDICNMGQFLHFFLCLHPFVAGNMGLAMAIVNTTLIKRYGSYIPHCHLDWCAHHLSCTAFCRVFKEYIAKFAIRIDSDKSDVFSLNDRMRNLFDVLSVGSKVPRSDLEDFLSDQPRLSADALLASA